MDISGTLTLSDTGKFTSFTADELWVNDLNLSGLSVSTSSASKVATLKVNQTIDMVAGHIATMFATVGFTGSITPKLYIKTRLEDSVDSYYFWDIFDATARFFDLSVPELNRMATLIVSKESGNGTVAGQIFGVAATNKNATVADFSNALSEIQNRIRIKYSQLNLE
jgi:hypothetical protein